MEHKVGLVKTPVVVVRGARDPLAPDRWAREPVGLAADGRLVTVPGAGHTVNYTHPAVAAAAVREVAVPA